MVRDDLDWGLIPGQDDLPGFVLAASAQAGPLACRSIEAIEGPFPAATGDEAVRIFHADVMGCTPHRRSRFPAYADAYKYDSNFHSPLDLDFVLRCRLCARLSCRVRE